MFLQVKMLLGAGADVDQKDKYGKTAYDYAHDKGYVDILHMLENPRGSRLSR